MPMFDTKYTSIGFFVRNWTHENREKVGAAHVLEHVLWTQAEFGAAVSGQTQLESILFQTTQTKADTIDNLKKLVHLLFDIPLSEKDFLIQKERIKLEIQYVYSHDNFKSLYGEIFGNNSGQYNGWSGSVAEIEAVTFEDVKRFREKYFTPENIVLVVTGDFDEKELVDAIAVLDIQRSLSPLSLHHIDTKEKIVWKTRMFEDAADVDIFLPSASQSDFLNSAKDDILMGCLTGFNFSLLDKLLYKQLGSVYFVEPERLSWTNGGVLTLGYRTDPDAGEKTADAVNEVLVNLPKYLTEDVFEAARKYSLLQHDILMRGPENLMYLLGENLLLTHEVSSLEDRRKQIVSCSYKQVHERAEQISKYKTVVIKD